MIEQEVGYRVGRAVFSGHLVVPSVKGRRPAVLIAHEALGLAEHTRSVARRLAELGYVAFAIDYLGSGRRGGVDFDVTSQLEAWSADPEPLVDAVASAHDVLRRRDDVDPDRVGAFGYCFGAQAMLEYARTSADLRAVVGFHPGLPVDRPDRAHAIRPSLLMLVGSADPFTPAMRRASFESEMIAAGVDWRMVVYGGVGHGFTNPAADAMSVPGVGYNRRADADSWSCATRFLRECGV